MSEQYESLEQSVREAMSQILSEVRPFPAPSPAPSAGAAGWGTVAGGSGEKLTEVVVRPDGTVVMRVGSPGTLQASAGAEVSVQYEPGIEPDPEFEPPCDTCCCDTCLPPPTLGSADFQTAAYSGETEAALGQILSATGMSRGQLLDRLAHRVMDRLIQQEARHYLREVPGRGTGA